MEEWTEYRLGDIISIASGFAYKGEFIGYGENILLGMGCVSFNETFLQSGARQYAGDCADRYCAKAGDIVLATRQQSDNFPILGMPAIVPNSLANKKVVIGANLYRVINNSDFDNQYIYWLLKTPSYVRHIRSCQTGTTVRMITKANIEDYVFKAPSKPIRDKISKFLWDIERKIEINRRINDNLEQQAQSLFKSWFVDFEPFKDGSFFDSELGSIPKGWKTIAFRDFIETSKEKAPVDSLPEYSVTNNGIIPRDAKFNKKLSQSTSMNKVLRKDDLVFGMSREILNWGIMEDEIGGVSSAYNIYKIRKELVSPTYLKLYMMARISDFNSLIGTAAREGQSLDKGQLMQKMVYIPTDNILGKFFALYHPIKSAICKAERESQRLASLRDTLLPRLMSGELIFNEINM